MKELFDITSASCSKIVTKKYSTSFSHGIYFLKKEFHTAIYGIYGFVRLADEIVDSFHGYDKQKLMACFRKDTIDAIENKISLNPILNCFQQAVHHYSIEYELIDTFLKSMEMDLNQTVHDQKSYKEYIVGSAEVVGLMCLRVFTNKDFSLYKKLKPNAMKLGSAFQKINFLRDCKADYEILGRTYFPSIDFKTFTDSQKKEIEKDINADFEDALIGIKGLPKSARLGVYIAFCYYHKLFKKIKHMPATSILKDRIRINNSKKIILMLMAIFRHRINAI